MDDQTVYLLHRGRNYAIELDRRGDGNGASLVTELIGKLEKPSVENCITIEQDVFKKLFETAALFEFLIDNIGRLQIMMDGTIENPRLRFVVKPPGQRAQFLKKEVVDALVEIRYRLQAPQYGVN